MTTYVCLDCGNEQTQDYRCDKCFGWTFETLTNLTLHYDFDHAHGPNDPPRLGYREAFEAMRSGQDSYVATILPSYPDYDPDKMGMAWHFRVRRPDQARLNRFSWLFEQSYYRLDVRFLRELQEAKTSGNIIKMLVMEAEMYRAILDYKPTLLTYAMGIIAGAEGRV